MVMYSLYLYFLGISLRNISKALTIFRDEERIYVSVGNWIQRFGSCKFYRRKRNSAFNIDKTMVKTGCKHVWILIVIEPTHKSVLGNHISKERNMFVTINYTCFSLLKVFYNHHVNEILISILTLRAFKLWYFC